MTELAACDLTAVIPTLGNHATLARALDDYETQTAAGRFEVVVAADRAEPDLPEIERLAGTRPYPVRVVRGGVPGASASRNAGWHEARSPLVLFTDDDILPTPDLVRQHLDWHAREPAAEVGVLGHVRWARELRVTPFMHWLDHGVQFAFPHIRGIEAGWGRFYTANVSIKAELLRRVGGFDEHRMPYLYEDIDWAYRADRLGMRLLYNRAAVAEHLRPMTLELWKQRARRLALSEREFVRLHPDVEPYFHKRFTSAIQSPPARGLGRNLIRWIPRRFPLLGRHAWLSADMYYGQAIGPEFLDAWNRAEASGGRGQPELSERLDAGLPGGSSPGPK